MRLLAAIVVALHPVVPWLALHPAKAPPAPPLAAPCRASDLHARLFLQGATGSLVGGVDVRNAGAAPCSLLGYPRVSFTGAASVRWRLKLLAASPAPLDVLADPPGSLRALAPGKSASVAIFWSNWCGAPPDALSLGIGGARIAVPIARAPRCDSPQFPSTVSVAPFAPTTRRLPESSRLPLRVAILGNRPVRVKPGLRAFRVHRGELLRYEVAVTNTGPQPFRFASTSCPVYVESLAPLAPQVYVLNCRRVGAIAARATVVFAMQIRIPAAARLGVGSITWELAPRTYQAPFAAAGVDVVR
jgi:Protein of unknown function (DUF4232)